ncbi:lipase family protein [Stutzerimonas stutzeri]|uniref:lipase family protein n=1 Tax=Stutzerimonas stutzeri TaxID=316 RepID=UPI000ABC580D|nr:lipase family protein [Stutzerimonas stutzeri]
MSTFVYAPFNTERKPCASSPPPYDSIGSIGHVLQNQLGRRVKPTQFDGAGPYHLLCEEVAYSKRLEIVPYDPHRYEKEAQDEWRNPEDVHFLYNTDANTQAFITHNDKVVLISVRGTQEMLADASRDADARQVPFEDGEGQAHRGFYGGFQAAKPFVERYLDAFYTGGQTLVICGHSLGGAIALLLAEWLRRKPTNPKVILYTYGAPRAGDAAFVKAAQPLTHHRIVNHNDPVPAVPLPWMDAEWKLALPGTALLFSSPVTGIALLLAGLVNLQGDPYEHHGEQWHFMPRKPGAGSEAAVLWQPGCALIDEQTCARYVGEIGLDGDMPNRLALGGLTMPAIAAMHGPRSLTCCAGTPASKSATESYSARPKSVTSTPSYLALRSYWKAGERAHLTSFDGNSGAGVRCAFTARAIWNCVPFTPMRWSRRNAFELNRVRHSLELSNVC